MFCLTQDLAIKLKEAMKNGSFDPTKIEEAKSSQEARDYFAKFVGEQNAEAVNTLYEKKLLLKNQEKAVMDFYREILGDKKFVAQRDRLAEQARARAAERKQKLYDPKENARMLNEITSDAYAKKYDSAITLDQSQTITELAQDVSEARAKIPTDISSANTKEGLAYGAAKRALENYTNALLSNVNQPKLTNPLSQPGIGMGIESIIENARISVNFIADLSRSLAAGVLDNSFFGNQGGAVLMNPKYTAIWSKQFVKSIHDIEMTIKGGVAKGDALLDAAHASTYSEPNFLNGRYANKGGVPLDVWTGEEEIPSGLLYKVPGLGRVAKAADVAFEIGAVRMRTSIANKMYKMYETMGRDMTDVNVLSDINKRVNSMTGRGMVGKKGSPKIINTAFFSVRYFKSILDVSTAHLFDSEMSPKMKWHAAMDLLYILAAGAVVIGIANTLDPNSIEMDPVSSDFGKIKVGSERINIPFITKLASIVTLLERWRRQETKSTATGIITPLGQYGGKNGMDVFWDFTENKFSPLASMSRDLIRQKTFEGDKPTIWSSMKTLGVPMGGSSTFDIWKDPENGILLKAISTALNYSGIDVNNYTPFTPRVSTSAESKRIQAKNSSTNANQYNADYNAEKIRIQENALKDPVFQRKPPDEQRAILNDNYAAAKKDALKNNHIIVPPAPKTPKTKGKTMNLRQ